MNKIIIEEWLTRAKRDFDVAHKLLSDSNHLEIVLFHVQQAVEKYLKGYLIFKGWRDFFYKRNLGCLYKILS